MAAEAGLVYLFDDAPGLRRLRRGGGFTYRDTSGRPVDAKTKDWIRSLTIPPAWDEVWVSPLPDAHLLATGRDQAGRKQYLYHPRWQKTADELKFGRLSKFGKRLPKLRHRLDTDLRRPGLEQVKVVALALSLLDHTLIRVGNQRYAADNNSHGLTTLLNRHVKVSGTTIELRFGGKGGREQRLVIRDRRLATLVERCQGPPGQTLFSFRHEGATKTVDSTDVNDYIAASIPGATAKDFRTWGASATVVEALASEPDDDPVMTAIDVAAERLGNTRAVCRASYLHPVVPDAFDDGRLGEAWSRSRQGKWLSRAESALLKLLD
jgi:DNA topoisomerase-1